MSRNKEKMFKKVNHITFRINIDKDSFFDKVNIHQRPIFQIDYQEKKIFEE